MLRRAILTTTWFWMLCGGIRLDAAANGPESRGWSPLQAATPDPSPPPPAAGVPTALPPPERLGGDGRRWALYADATSINGMAWASHWRGGEFWAATDGGALRLDDVGNRLRELTSFDGLPSNRVLSVALDGDGTSVWFGTAHGLARLDPDGHWLHLLGDSDQGRAVDRLVADPRRGDLWIHAPEGLFHWTKAQTMEDLTALRGRWYDEVAGMVLDEVDGDLWLAGPQSLTRRAADGSWARFTAPELGLMLAGGVITCLAISPDSRLWLGTSTGQVWQGSVTSGFVQAPVTHDWGLEPDLATTIETLAVDETGQDIWFAGSGRFAHADLLDPTKSASIDGRTVNGRRSTVRAILPVPDSESAHMGTAVGFLTASPRVGGALVHIHAGEPVEWEAPTAALAYEPTTGAVWIASAHGRIARRDNEGRWVTVADVNADGSGQPPFLLRDMALATLQGELWLATSDGAKVVRGSSGTVESVDLGSLLPATAPVWSVAADTARGTIWLGTDVGAVRIGGDGRHRAFTRGDGLPDGKVQVIAVDGRDGAAWLGTPSGLARVAADGSVRVVRRADGLVGDQVLALAMDAARAELWISTDRGVDVLDGRGVIRHILRVTGDRDRVDAIALDPTSGERWLGTCGRGLLRQTAAGAWDRYGTFDGLPDPKVLSLLVAGDELWIATNGGLLRMFGTPSDAGVRPPTGMRISLPWLGAPALESESG